MRPHLLVALACAALTACSKPPEVKGQVTDLFDHPISEATVLVEQTNERKVTDGDGRFAFGVEPGKKLRFKAGHDGYVPSVLDVEVPTDAEAAMPDAHFRLWPNPKEPGFYGKGLNKMIQLVAARVVALGSDLKEVHGIHDLPRTALPVQEDAHRFQLKSSLRASEISQLDLALHEMEFVEKTSIPGVTGEQDVDAHLYVARKEHAFELRAMDAENVFLITLKEPLPKGNYAFHTQGILSTTDLGALDKLPEELRVAYPFEIR